jgi:hypothetical protein
MSAFNSQAELYSVMKELWLRIKDDECMCSKLLESKLIVRFVYKDPDGCLTIDGSDGREMRIIIGNTELVPTVEMEMKSDFAHKFWLGRENAAAAILQGKIVSRGPVNKALALLPTIKPAFQIYTHVLEKAI